MHPGPREVFSGARCMVGGLDRERLARDLLFKKSEGRPAILNESEMTHREI
jgi:hypothetical protein